jgi:hypothetical protein
LDRKEHTLPRYPVTVTASYDATRAAGDAVGCLEAWAGAGDGRTFVVDDSIAPVRWTATADYVIDARGESDAERIAVGRFMAESSGVGIGAPETVIAATGPLN